MCASKIIIIYITPSWYMCTEILINQSNWIQYLFSFEFFQKSPSFDFKRVSLTTSNWVWGTESSIILYIYYIHKWVHFLQSELDNIKAEFEKLKDSSLHQRKKMTEIMASLMKDMSEIGSVVGGNANEFKVR